MSLLLVAGTTFVLNAQDKKEPKAKTETVVYDVSLSCENCKAKVEKHIAFEKGVKDLVVDLENKTVAITFDTKKNSDEELRKAIEKLGYTVAPRTTEKAKQ
jgi:copper chaperone CopZ